jgi:hypothetical protein
MFKLKDMDLASRSSLDLNSLPQLSKTNHKKRKFEESQPAFSSGFPTSEPPWKKRGFSNRRASKLEREFGMNSGADDKAQALGLRGQRTEPRQKTLKEAARLLGVDANEIEGPANQPGEGIHQMSSSFSRNSPESPSDIDRKSRRFALGRCQYISQPNVASANCSGAG